MNETVEIIIVVIVAFIAVLAYSFGMSKLKEYMFKKLLEKMLGKNQYQSKFHQQTSGMGIEEACEVLKIKKRDLKKMSKQELKSIFRKRIFETHPDHGGDKDECIKVQNAYEFATAF
jgi:nucleoside permease NupC